MNLSVLTYTNVKHSDAWVIYIGQMKKLFPFDVDHYFLVDTIDGTDSKLTDHIIKVYYDDAKQIISEQYISALDQIKTKYIIHDMEDFILYDQPKSDKLIECLNILDNTNYDYVRLIKNGVNNNSKEVYKNFYEIDSSHPYVYSHAATIWKRDSFKKVHSFVADYKNKNGIEAKKFEGVGKQSNTKKMLDINKEHIINNMCKENNLIKGLYYFDDDFIVPGTKEYASSIYPFLMTAIRASRWNYREYEHFILPDLLEEYKIDITKRGIIK